MKTIEERAEEYSKDKWGMGYSKGLEILRAKEGYIRGATEQEKITKKEMINKAKEAYCKASSCGVPRDACLSLGTCDKYDNFVKLLEE